jgi:toxin ParE1/3/4
MNYIVSPRARLDLIEIWEYTFNNWSVGQADKYYRILINRMSDIASNPNLGKDYGDFREGYRGVLVKSHLIFFKKNKNEPTEIIRILHRRVDLEGRISE